MNNSCVCCSNENFEQLFKHYIQSVKHTYGICKHCGMVQQTSRYPKGYYHSLPCTFPKDYENHAKRRAVYIMEFVLNFLKYGKNKVLDIGCGPGKVMEAIESMGHDCYGYTIGDVSSPKIKSKDVENDDLGKDSFNLIILSHVVEHFLTPIKTLSKIRPLLSTNGIMYIEVPSFYWTGLHLKTHPYSPEHISFFTKDSLINVIQSAGFTPIKIHESKYWGNIKVVCKKSDLTDISIKKLDYEDVITYSQLSKLTYPFFRLVKRLKYIKPND